MFLELQLVHVSCSRDFLILTLPNKKGWWTNAQKKKTSATSATLARHTCPASQKPGPPWALSNPIGSMGLVCIYHTTLPSREINHTILLYHPWSIFRFWVLFKGILCLGIPNGPGDLLTSFFGVRNALEPRRAGFFPRFSVEGLVLDWKPVVSNLGPKSLRKTFEPHGVTRWDL